MNLLSGEYAALLNLIRRADLKGAEEAHAFVALEKKLIERIKHVIGIEQASPSPSAASVLEQVPPAIPAPIAVPGN